MWLLTTGLLVRVQFGEWQGWISSQPAERRQEGQHSVIQPSIHLEFILSTEVQAQNVPVPLQHARSRCIKREQTGQDGKATVLRKDAAPVLQPLHIVF